MTTEGFEDYIEGLLGQTFDEKTGMDVNDVLKQVELQRIAYQQALKETVGNYFIDEMAIAFGDVDTMLRFVAVMNHAPGLTHFGGSIDTVQAAPLHSTYQVQYEWLTTPMQFRVEAMTVLHGYSPLHAHRAHYIGESNSPLPNNFGWIHASFKVPDEEAYDQTRRDMIEGGWYIAQNCQSTYGRFTYMSPGGKVLEMFDEGTASLYVKPRVNTRDHG